MENQESSNYEGLFIIGSIIIAFALTYVTKIQRERARKNKQERINMARELREIQKLIK